MLAFTYIRARNVDAEMVTTVMSYTTHMLDWGKKAIHKLTQNVTKNPIYEHIRMSPQNINRTENMHVKVIKHASKLILHFVNVSCKIHKSVHFRHKYQSATKHYTFLV